MQGKVSPERSAATGVYVGIDVCKGWLDVYLHPIGQGFRVANDRIGLKRLKRELALHEVALVAVEATGKFHRLVQRHLHAAGLAVAVTNPLRSRLFCEAIGQLAKTDAIDARLLAIMAESLNPRATPPPPEIVEELQEIVRARAAAVEDRTALLNQKAAARVGLLKSELARRIAAIERCLVRLEKAIQAIIARDTMLARRFKILLSIPGIGPIAAVGMLAGLAEMGARSGKEIAMLSGLAPVACDSGETNGQRRIRGGRSMSAPPSTSPPSLRPATIPTWPASIGASLPLARNPKWPSSPSCESSSCSPIPSSARTACGSQIQLDPNHRC